MDFEIVSRIRAVEAIAVGLGVRDRRRLNREYGKAKWRKGMATIRLADGMICEARGRPSDAARATADAVTRKLTAGLPHRFAICVRNTDYRASLELRKLYLVVDDSFAEQHDLIRVVDESGEDYLYPLHYFVRVDLPRGVERELAAIAQTA